ncbi:hypothetical protein P9112_001831 [Eukaryota sp. TZLM1-RC]
MEVHGVSIPRYLSSVDLTQTVLLNNTLVTPEVIDFIFWKSEEYGLSAVVRFHAVLLLEKYLKARTKNQTSVKIPMLLKSMNCLQIATKLHETACVGVSECLHVINEFKPKSHAALTPRDVMDSELEIMSVLSFETSVLEIYPLLEIMTCSLGKANSFTEQVHGRLQSVAILLLVIALSENSDLEGGLLSGYPVEQIVLASIIAALELNKVRNVNVESWLSNLDSNWRDINFKQSTTLAQMFLRLGSDS